MTEVSNVTSGFMQTGVQQGWQCPVCKRILSPWTIECPCRGQGMETYTTTDTEEGYKVVPYKESTTAEFTNKTVVYNSSEIKEVE